MLCERCKKNEASVFIDAEINGDKMKFSLCHGCALKDLNIKVFFEHAMPLPPNVDIICPGCGMSYAKIRKLMRFGCARCYDLLGDYILEKQDAATDSTTPPDDYEELKKKLSLAVKKEDYEEAARLRDEITKLKK